MDGPGMLLAFLFLTLVTAASCNEAEVYMVLMDGEPVSSYEETLKVFGTSVTRKPNFDMLRNTVVELYTSRLIRRHDELLQATFIDSSYKKLYSYHHLINGFAVHITPDQANVLRGAPGVKLVEKDWKVTKLTTHTPDFLGLPSVWSQQGGAGNAGEGVVIGMVDTGIDPSHPSFSGQGYAPLKGFRGSCEVDTKGTTTFCNGKIVAAQHFAAAAMAAGNFNASVDYDSPLDGDGHGSHTASIAAGNYNVPVVVDGFNYGKASGMAPRARLAIYKALYRQFGGFVADVVAAIDKAVADGVDVLNLSVGPNSAPSSSNSTFLSVFDMALLRATKQGVFVAQAAGNGGPYPRTIVSFGPWITTVAAGSNDRSYPSSISLGNTKSFIGIGLAPPTPGPNMYSLILAKDAVGNNSDYFFSPNDCQDPRLFNKELVRGKILICTFSFSFVFQGATVTKVAATAANLSAVGLVLVADSDLVGSKFEPVPISMPAIVITSYDHSQELLDYYNASTKRTATGKAVDFGATAKIANGQVAVFNTSAPQVALYSSRGPDVRNLAFQDADVLKPNILAPGSSVWGAWSPTGTDEPNYIGKSFALLSGTSMASPHVAGIAALLKKAFPNKSPAVIASAMMTTSSTVDNRGSPLVAQHVSSGGAKRPNKSNNYSGPGLETGTPFDFGHGAIDAKAALDPGLVFDASYADYINFLCSVPGVQPAAVLNVTKQSCAQTNGTQPLMSDLNLPSITVAHLIGERRVPRTATSVASKAESYTAVVTPPAGVSVTVNPTSFTVSQGKSVSFVVSLAAKDASDEFSFGELKLVGDSGHNVRIPISILKRQPQ